jgi:hypothetical protein
MAEDQAAQQQDLRQVPQAEFHPQPPQHDQKDHVGWQLKPVQHRAGPFIEAPPAAPAPEAPIAMCPSAPSSWPNSNAGTAFFISPHQRRSSTPMTRLTASWRET